MKDWSLHLLQPRVPGQLLLPELFFPLRGDHSIRETLHQQVVHRCAHLDQRFHVRCGKSHLRELGSALLLPSLKAFRQFSVRIQELNRSTEISANIRSYHCPHTKLGGCEIACQSAEIKRGDDRLERIRFFSQRAICLGQKSGNDSGESIARSSGAQARIAGWVNENSSIGRGNQSACSLQNQNDLMPGCKVARSRNTIA